MVVFAQRVRRSLWRRRGWIDQRPHGFLLTRIAHTSIPERDLGVAPQPLAR
jgi:hypothetical protein